MRIVLAMLLFATACAFEPRGLVDSDARLTDATEPDATAPDGTVLDGDGSLGDAAEADAAETDAMAIDATPAIDAAELDAAAPIDASDVDAATPIDASDVDAATPIDASDVDAATPIDATPIDAAPDPFCTSAGLEACFRMNQASGAPIDGHTPPITIARADGASYVAGCRNTALDLSASVFVRTGAPATTITNLTVEAWVKLNSVPSLIDGRRYWANANSSWELSYATDLGGNVVARCLVALSTTSFPSVTATLPNPTQWNHVACSWDGDRLRLFINGVRSENNVSGSSTPIVGGSAGIQLGRAAVDSILGVTQGQMDDVRVWSRRVSDAEIQATAAAGCP